ncbi:conserved hypothetical protein [Culex quinquefasciatus]|uniref:Outer dense fiber protein 3 n=1 Tax=Culex quinquefasciatus TaxID=7176 RepID=B0XLC3_CULQU|nr:outer dense fiber protein 3-like protein 2 [Culex quinquefasciatus]EDS33839.1 conserved hypothetical protein [Culex quinquefasciatus]|eukprot:XP_001870445.1 conserved hypothetical protein [Culex quinquefasciatus]
MYQMSRDGPGPAGYGLPSTIGYDGHDPRKLRKPMYTMKKRPTTRYDTTGPGPALYHPGRKTQHGNPYSPAFKMGYRFNTFSDDVKPGPGAYNVEVVPDRCLRGKRAATYVIGKRLPEPARELIPGPNVYAFPPNTCKVRNPTYQIGKKFTTPYALEGPGPAAYGVTSRNITHKRNPIYSMGAGRSMPITDYTGPGPADYSLMNQKPGASGPKWAFGVKHSMWRPPMIIPGDNC